MALQGRSLPVFNHSEQNEIGNFTMLDSYAFTESSPYEDSYYYLMIISDSIIKVNVKVVTSGKYYPQYSLNINFGFMIHFYQLLLFSECPIRITEKSFVRQYLDAPSFSKALAQLHMKDLTKHLHHDEIRYNKSYSGVDLMRNEFRVSDEDLDDPCVPRYQLARIKHSQTFSGVYLLQVLMFNVHIFTLY